MKGGIQLVGWYFEPSQPQRITSRPKTMFHLSPVYSARKSSNHKFPQNHKIRPDTNPHTHWKNPHRKIKHKKFEELVPSVLPLYSFFLIYLFTYLFFVVVYLSSSSTSCLFLFFSESSLIGQMPVYPPKGATPLVFCADIRRIHRSAVKENTAGLQASSRCVERCNYCGAGRVLYEISPPPASHYKATL